MQRSRGELEASIMNVLWDSARALTAKEVQGAFPEKTPAITTVITVLERMRAKGLVARSSEGGRSHVFAPTRSRLDEINAAMTSAYQSADDHGAALLLFAGSLSDEDRAFLRNALDSNTP
jgi:predicted transcriptional regulator